MPLPTNRSSDPAVDPQHVAHHLADHNTSLHPFFNAYEGTTPATFALAAHTHNASTALTSGTVPPARLGTGTASSATALFGDSTYKTVITALPAAAIETVYFSVRGNLVGGSVGADRAPTPGGPRTITRVRVSFPVGTGPGGQSAIFDVNLWVSPFTSGVSVWNVTQANRVTVASGATLGAQTTFNTFAVPDGSYVSVDVDQAGSGGTPGANAIVAIDFQAA